MLNHFLPKIADFFFPPRCLHCLVYVHRENVLCEKCKAQLAIYTSLWCGRCHARIPGMQKGCHTSFPYILGAALDYRSEVVRSIIRGIKFEFVREGASLLGSTLAEYVRSLGILDGNAVVVPIPLGTRRLRARGFNQAELIAENFAATLALPIERYALTRTKNTTPQSELSSFEKRQENIQGAFTANSEKGVFKKTVILIDDVTTSGATFYEAALALKKAGARRVVALAAARA